MVDQKNVLTKCLLLLGKCPWNGTWVKPFHSGNVHRDIFLFLASCAHLFFFPGLLLVALHQGCHLGVSQGMQTAGINQLGCWVHVQGVRGYCHSRISQGWLNLQHEWLICVTIIVYVHIFALHPTSLPKAAARCRCHPMNQQTRELC